MVDRKINSFEDLEVWQKSQDLAVTIYKITKKFPSDEKFALTNQLRRAASSISANIAEGFGRRGVKEKLQFYAIAYGSLLEVKNFIYLSTKLDYIIANQQREIIDDIVSCQKLLNALMRSINAKR